VAVSGAAVRSDVAAKTAEWTPPLRKAILKDGAAKTVEAARNGEVGRIDEKSRCP
jgi:hypothetical protein